MSYCWCEALSDMTTVVMCGFLGRLRSFYRRDKSGLTVGYGLRLKKQLSMQNIIK